ncbi:MAG TPA: hypothetical protein VF069_02630 [Streptosporangiaceae bacterium]
MADTTIHLIIRPTSAGDRDLYATSPQAPGLAYGRATLRELRADLQDVLAFHFDRPGPYLVVEHHERHYDIDGRELVTRVADDRHAKEREAVYERLGAALREPEQAVALLAAPTNAVGEVVYICAVPSDTMGWVAAQLDPRDAANVALIIADGLVLTMPVMPGDRGAAYSPGTTLGAILRTVRIVRPAMPIERPAIA